MPYRNIENWDKEDQEKDGQNNRYYIFPKDKQEFWNVAEKNGAIILHFVGRFSQQLPYYAHIIRVGKKHNKDYTVTNFIRTSTIGGKRIPKLFRDTFIIAVPKGWESALQYKERHLPKEQGIKQNPKKAEQTNKNFSLYIPREIKENPSDEMAYLEDINHTSLTKEEIEKLANKVREQPAFSQNTQNKLQRDPKIAKLALMEANFHCEVDATHPSFISRTSKLPYMEAHHLIPTAYSRTFYERYHINLDCKENIISLCPTCHRALHFGTDEKRNEILKILLKKRKEEFRKLGLNMTLSELIKFY